MSERYGKIEEGKTYEEREIEWKVMDISSLINSGKLYCSSPSFSFAGNSWCFQLYPNSPKINGRMSFYLYKVNCNEYSVEYTYGIKKIDGKVEHFGGGIFKEGDPKHSAPCYFIKVSEFEQRKSELAPSDVLTLTCMLKRGIPYSQQPKLKKLIKLDILSDDLKQFFANKDSCDVVLKVKDKEFKAHKAILMSRSSVFAAMFKHDTLEKQEGLINILDCDPDSFQEFLEYFYSGKLSDISISSAFQLYITSNKYDVQEIKEFCVEYLTKNLTADNVIDVIIFADKFDEAKLLSASQGFFNENFGKIFVTIQWESFMRNDYRLANKILFEMSKAKGSQ